MKRIYRIILLAIILGLLGLTGCTTMRISMNPRTPGECVGDRLPIKVGLFLSSDFQNYHWQGQSNAEMSKLDYDLGAASKSLLLETFTRCARGAVLVDKKPPYSGLDQDITVVIEPHISNFLEDHPAMLRISTYTAHIEYKIIVYDKSSNILIDKIYSGDGVVQGHATISPGSNYAAPAEVAMSKAIGLLLTDLKKLPLSQ